MSRSFKTGGISKPRPIEYSTEQLVLSLKDRIIDKTNTYELNRLF